jgi:hypothetical protein
MVSHAGRLFYPFFDCPAYSVGGFTAIIAADLSETSWLLDRHMRRIYLDGFDPATRDQAVSGSSLAQVQLSPGSFHGRLASAQAGQQRLDCGQYDLPLFARGELKCDGAHDRRDSTRLAAQASAVPAPGHRSPAPSIWSSLVVV